MDQLNAQLPPITLLLLMERDGQPSADFSFLPCLNLKAPMGAVGVQTPMDLSDLPDLSGPASTEGQPLSSPAGGGVDALPEVALQADLDLEAFRREVAYSCRQVDGILLPGSRLDGALLQRAAEAGVGRSGGPTRGDPADLDLAMDLDLDLPRSSCPAGATGGPPAHKDVRAELDPAALASVSTSEDVDMLAVARGGTSGSCGGPLPVQGSSPGPELLQELHEWLGALSCGLGECGVKGNRGGDMIWIIICTMVLGSRVVGAVPSATYAPLPPGGASTSVCDSLLPARLHKAIKCIIPPESPPFPPPGGIAPSVCDSLLPAHLREGSSCLTAAAAAASASVNGVVGDGGDGSSSRGSSDAAGVGSVSLHRWTGFLSCHTVRGGARVGGSRIY